MDGLGKLMMQRGVVGVVKAGYRYFSGSTVIYEQMFLSFFSLSFFCLLSLLQYSS